jgi:hypothetical protein
MLPSAPTTAVAGGDYLDSVHVSTETRVTGTRYSLPWSPLGKVTSPDAYCWGSLRTLHCMPIVITETKDLRWAIRCFAVNPMENKMKRLLIVTTASALALIASTAFAQSTGTSNIPHSASGDGRNHTLHTDGAGNASPNTHDATEGSVVSRPIRSGSHNVDPSRSLQTDGAGNASLNTLDAAGGTVVARPIRRGTHNVDPARSLQTDGAGNASPNSQDAAGR